MLTEECSADRLRTTSAGLVERVQLAVLKFSEGDLDKFLDAVTTAQLDWRDVPIWAGFGDDPEAHLKWAEDFRR